MDHVLASCVETAADPLFKRPLDAIVALLILLLSFPVLICIAAAIKCDSPGPVFFCQERFGHHRKIIRVYKFRSMVTVASDYVGLRQTQIGDPRITRVGRLLRMHSIDEIPQLINVVLGDMALVGPRPMPIGTQVEGCPLSSIYHWDMRYTVKPGVTGLAQISGSRGQLTTIDAAYKRLYYDLDYIANRSLWRDLCIIGRTVLLCLYDEKAY